MSQYFSVCDSTGLQTLPARAHAIKFDGTSLYDVSHMNYLIHTWLSSGEIPVIFEITGKTIVPKYFPDFSVTIHDPEILKVHDIFSCETIRILRLSTETVSRIIGAACVHKRTDFLQDKEANPYKPAAKPKAKPTASKVTKDEISKHAALLGRHGGGRPRIKPKTTTANTIKLGSLMAHGGQSFRRSSKSSGVWQ